MELSISDSGKKHKEENNMMHLLDTNEVYQYFGGKISKWSIREAVKRKELTPVRLGNKFLFETDALYRWVITMKTDSEQNIKLLSGSEKNCLHQNLKNTKGDEYDIILEYIDKYDCSHEVETVGRWLVRDEREDMDNVDFGTRYSVVQTSEGELIHLWQTPKHGGGIEVYSSFEEMIEGGTVPPGICSIVAHTLGKKLRRKL